MSTPRRVALVTGGARRVGAEIARSFAGRDYDLLLHHGNSPDDAASLATELTRQHGVRVEVVQEDLREAEAPARIVDAALTRFGVLDVVVSSASVMEYMALDAVTPEHWAHTEAVNLRAPFFLMQAAARVLRDGGVIVQMSDHLAFETLYPNLIPHQVTKAGVTTLVTTMAAALAPRIRVNAVAPGLVLAPDNMSDAALQKFLADVPLARSGTPQDVVRAIHYLVDATYVTGEVLRVDGGRHLRR
ncbi:MAG TPA: SDR family oxidoreductase [Gemmatimonas sp.]|uniref:SDR family oxidoreductase n=1 Tax=Gemmatimonas sp. TaxID=1962908 RepID=UPI002ED81EE4